MPCRGCHRKARAGEIVCRCAAYRFPHRFMGGECSGGAFVDRQFLAHAWDECRDCALREVSDDGCELRCQAADGRERLTECPALEEHIRFHGVRLYGANRPPVARGRVGGFLSH